jgi:homoserine dehydrogenase
VGGGVVRLLEANAALIARRAGRPITISAISARNRSKDRGVDLSGYAWEDDMVILGERPDVDVVVELVGGADGPALALARTTFEAGKALVHNFENAEKLGRLIKAQIANSRALSVAHPVAVGQ